MSNLAVDHLQRQDNGEKVGKSSPLGGRRRKVRSRTCCTRKAKKVVAWQCLLAARNAEQRLAASSLCNIRSDIARRCASRVLLHALLKDSLDDDVVRCTCIQIQVQGKSNHTWQDVEHPDSGCIPNRIVLVIHDSRNILIARWFSMTSNVLVRAYSLRRFSS